MAWTQNKEYMVYCFQRKIILVTVGGRGVQRCSKLKPVVFFLRIYALVFYDDNATNRR